jgi:cell volume regulation protein A
LNDVETFGLIVAVTSVAALLAVLSNRVSQRTRIPAPVIFLLCAAGASQIWSELYGLSTTATQRIVTVALAVLLFDGGMHIGWRRIREAAAAVTVIGIVGTFLTAGGLALLIHYVFSFGWRASLLLGTALAPTDPAVVFSVLGRREITGRTGTILEGESGANDPVGIALLLAIATATGSGASVVGHAAGEFALQMAVGLAIGIVGGFGLLHFMRRVPLPAAGLYPIRALASALALYGIAAYAHGSGFLAVFVAGIIIGDERAPYKAEMERFASALASVGEIVAFVVLGLTVHLEWLGHDHAWAIGLGLAALLAFIVRPALVGLLTIPLRLRLGEKVFLLFAGLKGAVPILLGTFILLTDVDDRQRIYAVIFVVVAFSVIVQGSLVPTAAARLGVPMRAIEPAPWAVGVRLREEPEGLRRFVVGSGSAADGSTIADLPIGDDAWISLVTRHGRLLPNRGDTALHAGDEVLAIVDPLNGGDVSSLFRPTPRSSPPHSA